jgi:hypothetical protein
MIIEDSQAPGFDLYNLEYSPGKQINVCAFELLRNKDNKVIVNRELKNIASIPKEGVKCNMDQFKYLARFDGIIVQAKVAQEEDKYLATASINQLKKFLPSHVDLDVNKDLLGVAFDAFVVNRGNKNGHMISTENALAMVSNFINKPFNIEHNRKTIVGFCTGYGFSEFGSSNPLSLEHVTNTDAPFNVVLSGFVWKVANPEFAEELVNSSDPSSSDYLSVSASWELGFNEFNIAEGSKNLNEANIIEDEEEILKHKDDLKVFGGSGISTMSGKQVFLNLQGTILPLGIGFTNNPAAEVKGVVITHDKPEDIKNTKEDNEMNKKSVSSEIKDVKNIMQINQIEDITDEVMKEVSASAVREFISNKITELAKDWAAQKEEKENALKATQEELVSLKTDLDSIKAESEKIKADFAEVQENIRKQEIEATFQRRMSLLDDEFNLTDADRAIVAEDLQAIAEEEAFEKWYNRFATLAEAKKKAVKKNEPKDGMERESVVDDTGMSGGTSFSSKKSNKDGEDEEEKSEKKDDKKEEKDEEVDADEEMMAKKGKGAEPVTEASFPTPAGKDIKNDDYSHRVLKTNDANRKGEVDIKAPKTVEQVVDAAVEEAPLIPNIAAPADLSLMEKISAAFNKSSVRIKR